MYWYKWEHTQHDGYKSHCITKHIVEAETIEEAEKKFSAIREEWGKKRGNTSYPFFSKKVHGPFKTKEEAENYEM